MPGTYISPAETGLYYLQSRYYNPEIGRFINADNQIAGVGGDVLGYNLFAYCNNNPVIYSDELGHSPEGAFTQFCVSLWSYVGIWVASLFDEDVRDDMNAIGWNPFNDDESKVMSSDKVSFYKGVPVIQISEMGGSISLGVIGFDKSQGVEVLKHERGHNTQLMSMGLGNYLIQIGIPSVWKNGDETPWELSASMLGESVLADGYSENQKKQAQNYFKRSKIPGVNVYNIIQYIFY